MKEKLQTIIRNVPESKYVLFTLYVKAGSIYETLSTSGITDFLCRLLLRSLPNVLPERLAVFLYENAIDYSVITYRDSVEIKIICPIERTQTAIAFIKGIFSCSEWSEREVDANKSVVLTKLFFDGDFQQDTTEFYVQDRRYSIPIAGLEDTINSFSATQINGFKRSIFTMENSLLLIAGEIAPPLVLDDFFDIIPNAPVSDTFPLSPPKGFKHRKESDVVLYITDTEIVNLEICFDFSFDDIILLDYQLLCEILSMELSDVLVYEKYYTDSINVSIDLYPGFGRFYISTRFSAEQLSDGIRIMQNVIFDKTIVNQKTIVLKNAFSNSITTLSDYAFVEGRCPFILGIRNSFDYDIISDTVLIERIKKLSYQLFRKSNFSAYIEYNPDVDSSIENIKTWFSLSR